MLVKKLTVNNFRNLKPTVFIPEKEMNVICGENAQGKTNLIEAIWLFTGAKSFRGNKDNELPFFDSQKAKLTLIFESEGIEKTASITIDTRRHAVLNEKKLSSAAALAGQFCAIVFSPDDIGLVTDGPSKRRRFMDIAISQIYPSYLGYLRNYTRAVTQRNVILKDIRKGLKSEAFLDVFEQEIVSNGKEIIKYRIDYVDLIKEKVSEIYRGISADKEELSIEYIMTAEADNLKNELIAARQTDIYSATTSVGPHRDDLAFKINGVSVRNFASQGQRRSVALSLKLSEAEILKKITGEFPVALLDDVMSELDPIRQNYILNHIKGWQVFITCCDPSNTENLDKGKVFSMKEGRLSE